MSKVATRNFPCGEVFERPEVDVRVALPDERGGDGKANNRNGDGDSDQPSQTECRELEELRAPVARRPLLAFGLSLGLWIGLLGERDLRPVLRAPS